MINWNCSTKTNQMPPDGYYTTFNLSYNIENGCLHSETGPAVEMSNGAKQWWHEGKRYYFKDNEKFLRFIKCKVFW